MIIPKTRPDRAAEMDAFLHKSGWHGAVRTALAADASFRRYERVMLSNAVAMLMDAPPPWEDVQPFMRVNAHLRRYRMSVPSILAADAEAGFLLLEDLGDASFTRLLKENPAREGELYRAAMAVLIEIYRESQRDSAEQLPPYNAEVYLREVALFAEWFLPQVVGLVRARELRNDWLQLWSGILAAADLQQHCLVHRDYHADNLFWLAERDGHRAVGLLDFQDALWGDAAYDVASLLEDARRDVSQATVAACLQQFIADSGIPEATFMAHYAVLAAQRNAKIVGIFTRLAVRDGKAKYLDYLPRVWGHLMHDVQHPLLAPIAEFMEKHVPPAWRGAFTADATLVWS